MTPTVITLGLLCPIGVSGPQSGLPVSEEDTDVTEALLVVNKTHPIQFLKEQRAGWRKGWQSMTKAYGWLHCPATQRPTSQGADIQYRAVAMFCCATPPYA